MKKVVLWLYVSYLSLAFGQTEVNLDTEGYIPTVKIEDPGIKTMCQALAKKLGTKVERISFRPKPVFPSRIKDAGKIWIIETATEQVDTFLTFEGQLTSQKSSSTKNGRLEFPNSELVPVLQKIVGPVALNVRLATCYIVDSPFYNTENVLLVPTDKQDAEELVSVMR